MIHRDPKLPVRTCVSAPKWFAVVGDQIFPMPRREITRNVLLQQSGLPADHVLVRDRQSQHDELIPVGATIDLGVGNVFRLLPPCTAISSNCNAPSKLAFAIDDHFEITVNPNQTKSSIRGLFGLDANCDFERDFASPKDQQLADNDPVVFSDGPQFTKLEKTAITVVVNGRRKTIQKSELTFAKIIRLAFNKPPAGANVCFTVTYRGGCGNASGSLVEGDSVEATEGMVINVTATDKS